jgi:sec-independent protein translocase protein TatA
MGSLSIWHWLVVLCAAAVLFGGRGKITSVMGDFAKGIKAFKSGMKEEDEPVATVPPVQVTAPPPAAAAPAASVGQQTHEHV